MLNCPTQLKAERLERQRDDPYYVGSSITAPPTRDAVDSIPIVQLDLNFAAPARVLSPPPREPTPPPVHVDVDGEMPDGFDMAPSIVEAPAEVLQEKESVLESQAAEGTAVKVVKKKRKEQGAKKKKKEK